MKNNVNINISELSQNDELININSKEVVHFDRNITSKYISIRILNNFSNRIKVYLPQNNDFLCYKYYSNETKLYSDVFIIKLLSPNFIEFSPQEEKSVYYKIALKNDFSTEENYGNYVCYFNFFMVNLDNYNLIVFRKTLNIVIS